MPLPPLPHQALLDHLRGLSQINLQPNWRLHWGALPQAEALSPNAWSTWAAAALNDRAHIAWEAGKQVLWLGQRFVVPEQLQGYALAGHQIRLDLTWWADHAQIFINGELAQEGDLFDCVTKFRLSSKAQPGQVFDLAICLISPGHDRGALVLSRIRFEAVGIPGRTCPEPGFVADELTVLGRYLQRFAPEKLEAFAAALADFDAAGVDAAGFDIADWNTAGQGQMVTAEAVAPLERLRDRLLPFSPLLKQRRIDLLGHAHLDMAWLWPVAETWEAAERTFESALALQAEFPALTFGHSSPALYAWIQDHRPALFARIKAAIAEGRWEVIAGPWIEPDCILPSGESLVRQLLYGQRYVEQELGVQNRVAWLPDSFGFCHQLPQILKQAGVDYFVTEKLLWNDTTQFPHPLFHWRSPDGTAITSYMSARIGTQIDAVQMADYACDWETATGQGRSLWLPGVGDHGGGPTREMLETTARWQASPFFPAMDFTTVHGYLDDISHGPSAIPTWDRDLYLEYHRGCYSSHADQKRDNRQSEALLYEAELWSSLATLATDAPYPQAEIEALWKKVLFNQFHDILPGSSIPEVFADANRDWAIVFQRGDALRAAALTAIAQAITLPAPPQADAVPLVIFNSLNWCREEARSPLIRVDLPEAGDWQAQDLSGQPLPSQPLSDHQLLIQSPNLPGVGYALFWLCPVLHQSQGECGPEPKANAKPLGYQLENDHLRITLNPQTGDLAQVFSKALNRDLLSGPGNQLQAFRDQGQYWDAWNIDPDYEQHRLPESDLISLDWIAQGPLEWRLRVVRRISQSRCRQDYVLQLGSPLLRIETEIDWQEDHVLLKAAFPLTLEADALITEVPHGVISRTTTPQTEAEKAQWEVPALRWADLSTAPTEPHPWGVSLLNDCKYGYDAGPSQIRLTLLRSSNWPDPGCDRGLHRFTYALYAHPGDWKSGQTVRHGYELQHPPQAIALEPQSAAQPAATQPQHPASAELLHLGDSGFILTALKQSEAAPPRWILHGYESLGEPTLVQLRSSLDLTWGERTDGLERPLDPGADRGNHLRPWEIVTAVLETPGGEAL